MRHGWFKSSFSTASGDCVEVRFDGGVVRVRDTKDRGLGPVITIAAGRWAGFVRGLRAGRFARSARRAEPNPLWTGVEGFRNLSET